MYDLSIKLRFESNDAFCVDFDNLWRDVLGYTRKYSALDMLKAKFEKKVDYIILRSTSENYSRAG